MYRFWLFLIGIISVTSFCLGSIVVTYTWHPSPRPTVVTYTGSTIVPVVTINGIRNGKLEGTVSGDARLFARSTIVLPDGSGAFAIGDTKLLTNIIEIHIPAGMNFVASKKGKKYYAVTSASASNLSPANRVYFPDAASAEAAGFTR